MFFSSLVARLVSLPYGFTLFSNTRQHLFTNLSVSLPYGFTLSQTVVCSGSKVQKFHYLMDLHYSQTDDDTYTGQIAFHYLMDLHYSQTINSYTSKCMCFTTLWIYTILKPAVFASRTGTVSLPYGFTLFSNKVGQWLDTLNVSLPYGFTLFSNSGVIQAISCAVSLPYGFTLFSNYSLGEKVVYNVSLPYGFTLFSNTRVIDIIKYDVSLPYGFTLFSNLK